MAWPGGEAPGGGGAERDEQIHVAGERADSVPAGAVEAGAEAELNDGGEGELRPGREHKGGVDHAPNQGRGQHGGGDQVVEVAPVLRGVVFGGCLGLDFGGAVAGFFDGFDQAGEVWVRAGDVGAFGGEVDRGSGDVGNPRENLFDAVDAGGAGHAGYGEVDGLGLDGGVHVRE